MRCGDMLKTNSIWIDRQPRSVVQNCFSGISEILYVRKVYKSSTQYTKKEVENLELSKGQPQ